MKTYGVRANVALKTSNTEFDKEDHFSPGAPAIRRPLSHSDTDSIPFAQTNRNAINVPVQRVGQAGLAPPKTPTM